MRWVKTAIWNSCVPFGPTKTPIRLRTSMRRTGMNALQIKGNWNEIKGKLKQKYAQLTDSDLTFAEGKEEELLGRLQQRLGKKKEELRREIDEF